MRVEVVMPMAGRGSRFAASGERLPKPLIPLHGRPFFAWAAESLLRQLPAARLTCVVLAEHVRDAAIDVAIRSEFPTAQLLVLPETTAGALDTALAALPSIEPSVPLFINDCDHAFHLAALPAVVEALRRGATDGVLCHFRESTPQFSYARYDADGLLIETAEKRVISDRAIAGAYGFRSADLFAAGATAYRANCPYPETYVSGVYNELVRAGQRIAGVDLDAHVSFGTPSEYMAAHESGGLPWLSPGRPLRIS